MSIPPQTRNVLTSDGQKIVFDHYAQSREDLVIIAHGFFNSKDSVLLKDLGQALLPKRDVILMDFRGHGKSQGLFYWTAKEHLDLLAVLDAVENDYRRIAVIGFSLGAATTIITAVKTKRIGSVIAVSSPVSFEKIEFHFWDLDVENDIFYNLTGQGHRGKGVRPGPFWLKKERPIEVVDQITCPILFLHGEADWVIRPWHSQALFDKARSPKEIAILKNGPHAEYLVRKNKSETVGHIRDWLDKTLNGKGTAV